MQLCHVSYCILMYHFNLYRVAHAAFRADKSDFNDTLQEEGYHAVSERINSVLYSTMQKTPEIAVSWGELAPAANDYPT